MASDKIYQDILLGGPPPLRVQQARVPTDKVVFDDTNPRLKYKKELAPNESNSDLLLKESDTKWLQVDIEKNGILDPIYVKAMQDGSWLVIEGNRRTACQKKLRELHPDDPKFEFMPAQVLPPETDEKQVALLMASFHVAGKLTWQAHEKAGHVWHMVHVLNIPMDLLETILHMGKAAIGRTASSYGLLEYFKAIDNNKYSRLAEGKWSFFAEMLKVKEYRKRYEKADQTFIDDFCRWVGDGRLTKGEDVRHLLKIHADPKAKRIFLNDDPATAFKSAMAAVSEADPANSSKFFTHLKTFVTACKAATFEDLDTAGENEIARDKLLEAHTVLIAFMEKAGIRPATPRRVA